MNRQVSIQPAVEDDVAATLLRKIEAKTADVGIVGLGYVGLPLVQVFCAQGFPVTGFDIDAEKVTRLADGESYIRHIPSASIVELNASGRFKATTDFAAIGGMDAVLICVPTPLTQSREPDMRFVVSTAEALARHLRPGQLIILESTTYPGTTEELVRPILETSGLVAGRDFFLAYSPEREDPGNPDFGTAGIPKVVGGADAHALQLADRLYGHVVVRTVPVSNTRTAEAVKLTENIFRAVNIALVNELKQIYSAMDIDIWEVIEAAESKPFGFMPFYPGPGLGGHCIPIDPFYLTWRASAFGIETRFIELAGEINTAMPRYVIDRLAEALEARFAKQLAGARVLVVGLAYKKNVDDIRESPGFTLVDLMEERGAKVDYHDPYVPRMPETREHPRLAGRSAVPWTAEILASYDAAIICTDHEDLDYRLLVDQLPLVVDSRNVLARLGLFGDNVVKA